MRINNRILVAAAACMSLAVTAAPQIGAKAPDFSLTDSKGINYSLNELAGKTVVLEWTNHDCPFVKKHYEGNMQALQQRFTAQDVVWLSVISSAPGKQGHVSAAEADALTASRQAAPTAVLFDASGVTGKAYDAKTTPHMYVIDKAGVLQYMGGIDSIPSAKVDDIAKATPYFANAASAVLAGEAPNPAVTKPYGCSVKY